MEFPVRNRFDTSLRETN